MSDTKLLDIEFENVSKTFISPEADAFTAVEGLSLKVRPGRLVAIIGPSGCGKSTLLNMTAGLIKPSEGVVRYQGEPVSRINTSVGYMTQADSLLPWRTVAANVRIPLEVRRGVDKRDRNDRVMEVLSMVGLAEAAKKYPAELSGGMRKRVALARSLVYQPDTMLMDEPFGALDAQLRSVLQDELLSLWQKRKKTILFVTHDLEEAVRLGDEVVVFGTNPGRIIHIEQIDLPRPRSIEFMRTDPQVGEIWRRLWALMGYSEEPT